MKGINMLDKRDIALQTLTPSVMVPLFSKLDSLEHAGQRFLLAKDGLWVQIKREWLDLTVPLATQCVMPIPCGELSQNMQFNFGTLPIKFLKQFIKDARASFPNECAAWFIWNEVSGDMRYVLLEAENASIGAVTYVCPELEEGEHMIADIHSHGETPAFFSFQDNDDDKTEVKIAIVVGNVDTSDVSIKMRLCANGYFVDLPCDSIGEIGGYDA
jgi:PRTRC genetic system protein A